MEHVAHKEAGVLQHPKGAAGRTSDERACTEALAFESVLSTIAARLLAAFRTDEPSTIEAGLEAVRVFFKADRATLSECRRSDGRLRRLHSALSPGTSPPLDFVEPEHMPWYTGQLREGRPVRLASVLENLPPEAAGERRVCVETGLKADLAVPIDMGGGELYVIAICSFSETREWSDELIERLRLVGRVLASSLLRSDAERRIERAKQEWEQTFDAVPDLILLVDENHRVVRVNRALADKLGVPPSDLVDRPCHQAVHGLSCVLGNCPHDATMQDGNTHSTERYEDVLGGFFRMTVTPLRGADGKIWGSVHVAHDVTDHMLEEESLRAAHDVLDQRVRERTAELSATVKKLAAEIRARELAEAEAVRRREELAHMDRVNAMGVMASSLAHELNQPLVAIVSNAQAALRFMAQAGIDPDEHRDILEDIAGAGKRAGSIIQRMRSLLKKGENRFEPVSLAEVVTQAISLLHSDAVIRHVTVDASALGALPPVEGDNVQLLQVFLNLLLNASDAQEEGPVAHHRVEIAGEVHDASVRVAVRDWGPGIPADQLDAVFDPFHSTKPQGMGMGLAIARSIIESHKGRLWAENRPEVGAVLYLELPVADGGEAAS